MKRKIKRILSFCMVFLMLFGIIPWNDCMVYAIDLGGGAIASKIELDRVEEISDTGAKSSYYRLRIYGSNLKANTKLKIITNSGSNDYIAPGREGELVGFLEYKITDISDDRFDNDVTIVINDSKALSQMGFAGVPKVNSIESVKNEISGEYEYTMKGSGLDKYNDTVDTIIADKSIQSSDVIGTPTNEELKFKTGLNRGTYDVTFQKKSVPESGVTIKSIYINKLIVKKDLILSNIKVSPTIGAEGDKIRIEGNGLLDGLGVYFLGINDDPTTENKKKAKDVSFNPGDKDNLPRLTVTIPNLMNPGKYYIYIYDEVNKVIVAEKRLDQIFTFILSSEKATVERMNKDFGGEEGGEVGNYITTIDGKKLITPNIQDLKIPFSDMTIKMDEKVQVTDNKTSDMKFTYEIGGSDKITYEGREVKNLYRTVEIYMGGGKAKYVVKEDGTYDIKKISGKDGGTEDSFDIIVPPAGDTTVKDAPSPVYITITTKITLDDGEEIYYVEDTRNGSSFRGFTYIKTSTRPTIEKVFPPILEFNSVGDARFEMDDEVQIIITGKDFIVTRAIDGDKSVLIYPEVYITNETSITESGIHDMNIYLDKSGQPMVKIKDKFNKNPIPIKEMIVLDDKGQKVSGEKGNDTGTKILFTLPKSVLVDNIGKRNIIVRNPLRNSLQPGPEQILYDAMEFIPKGNKNMVIDSVNPSEDTVNGGASVEVTGNGFTKDCKVLIGGTDVGSVQFSGNIDGSKVVLKFKAPAGRVGTTKLQVYDPETGAIATTDFTYVPTFGKDPKLTSLSPPKGTKGLRVSVKGENFLKADLSITDPTDIIDRYKLVGTRIEMDGKDINKYNGANNKPELVEYSSKEANLLTVDEKTKQVILSDYFYSVILEEKLPSKSIYYRLDKDPKGNIILYGTPESNNESNQYTLSVKDNKLIAMKNGVSYEVTVSNSGLTLKSDNATMDLKMKTVYVVEDGIITGNNVEVLNTNEILFTVPDLSKEGKGAGLYDVTVRNPDTKSDTKKKSFEYVTNPLSKPTITYLDPSMGSAEGGYYVTIYGSDFSGDTVVRIDGVIVPKDQTQVTAGKEIKIVMPKYKTPARFDELNTDKIPVVVNVSNEDGGSISLKDGFTYMNPDSRPKVLSVAPSSGSAAGYDVVTIKTKQFIMKQPYGIEEPLKLEKIDEWIQNPEYGKKSKIPVEKEIPGYDGTYYDSPLLPDIIFGSQKSYILRIYDVEPDGVTIDVATPKNKPGAVDVYFTNPDTAVSNPKGKYTYNSSKPIIDKLVPAFGSKVGREEITIYGKEFDKTSMSIYDVSSKEFKFKEMALVRFGDINNRAVKENEPNYGKIGNLSTKVSVTGGLTVDYDVTNKKLKLSVIENGKSYSSEEIDFDHSTLGSESLYIPVHDVIKEYKGYELVRIDVENNRIIVERGYSPETVLSTQGDGVNKTWQILVKNSSFYTVGKVNLTVITSDLGEAKKDFEFTNPDSKPKIQEILKENQQKYKEEPVNGKDAKIVEVNYKGGSNMSILGEDFRGPVSIEIGSALTIKDVPTTSDKRIDFVMPEVNESEVGKVHPVVVINNDKGFASSEKLDKPIYIKFIKGESEDLSIEKVVPNSGSSKGGTKIEIVGNGFRQSMEGWDGKTIEVYIGGVKVPNENILSVSYNSIVLMTPSHAPGKVAIKVINPDDVSATLEDAYTYTSEPIITTIVSPTDDSKRITEISVDGKEQIKLKGSDFMQGAKVVFAPVLEEVKEGEDTANTIIISGKRYKIKSGYETTDVSYIDSQNVLVKTPPGKLGEKGVILINPDGAATPIYQNIVYVLSKISAPTGVFAEILYDRYIKVSWDAVEGADEYEIYVVVNDRTQELVGTTKSTSFVYQDLEKNTKYKFIVKALGQTGLSNPSMESNTVKTGSKVGPPDTDGSLTDNTTMSKDNTIANVSVGTKDIKNNEVVIDLTSGVLSGAKEVVISMPAKIVTGYSKDIVVIGLDFTARFNPSAFNVGKVYENGDNEYAGVKFRISLNDVKDVNSLSNEYNLTAKSFVGKDSADVDILSGKISFSLDYDLTKANFRKLQNIGLYRYDAYSAGWHYIKGRTDEYLTSINTQVDRLGRYSIIGYRR